MEDAGRSAPSTFVHCAAGHPSTTWTSSAGQGHRLDYVLLPAEWQQWPVRAYPSTSLSSRPRKQTTPLQRLSS
eukprot:13053668-Alexandrium_andersonii.AAC.1